MSNPYRLSRAKGRALRRLSELSRLAAWRAQHDVALVDPCGFALAVADALAVSPRHLDYPAFLDAVGAVVPENVALQALHRVDDLEQRKGWRYRLYAGSTAGRMADLTCEERLALKITTMAAVDETTAERADRARAERRKRDAERKRAARGRMPRKLYEGNSVSRTRPWEAFGVCRRTWERWGKPDPDVATMSATVTRH